MHSAAIINQPCVTMHCFHLLPTVILALKVSNNMHLASADLSFKSTFRKKPWYKLATMIVGISVT